MKNYVHPVYVGGAIEVFDDFHNFALSLAFWCSGLAKEVRVYPDGNGDMHYYITKFI